MAGLLKEMWEGELIKHFRHEATFLSRIPQKNQYVNNDAIHLAMMGADPAVLINNTTYPINSAQRTDQDIVIALDKLDTENTLITDDELYGLPYDKPGSVLNQHREVLEEKAAEKSLHSLCPSADSATTPVVLTTGDSNGETNARKRIKIADIVKLKKYLDLLKVPKVGRELVLNPYHIEDLLLTSEAFEKQWYNRQSGQVFDMFGFIISELSYYPVFSNATGNKKAFGAAPNAADDLQASVVFYNRRAAQARGTAGMYYAKAENDPKYRRSEVGFRIHHICLPIVNTGFGAIVSNIV